jgi:hypothetical protein
MLGYSSKAELLATGQELALLLDRGLGKLSAGSSPELVRIEPVDIEWKRKNGTTLKARLSGRGVVDEQGNLPVTRLSLSTLPSNAHWKIICATRR